MTWISLGHGVGTTTKGNPKPYIYIFSHGPWSGPEVETLSVRDDDERTWPIKALGTRANKLLRWQFNLGHNKPVFESVSFITRTRCSTP